MVLPDKTIFIQGLNFVVMIFLLNVVLIRPVREIIKKRKGLMADQLEKIEGFNAGAEEKLVDYETQLTQARKEAGDIRSAAKDEGVAQEQAILSEAGREASDRIKAARAEIQAEAKVAMEQLSKDVYDYAEQATGKILGQA
ncbi:ATP synthase F0 subunit B [Pseudodesulfovibrio thermohalotolerans]|jgi:F-type H+-transporting ATPase subunit b|uniref:ATP synthase F0 subunit B n=1 Tax=Pseudodesulfovibrio thermohalotolerans TaxID=2880651 RepID=UPI0022BA0A9D|nr:ATP synthase F0 subunit B [Pseudodesulfovibrio thermohalotolerans]WFS62863.1 ATP synthase F0 subunit B [Pseudodesulfovibrio thermohalotolerans]